MASSQAPDSRSAASRAIRSLDERLVEERAARDAGAHRRVEVRLGAGPVGGENPSWQSAGTRTVSTRMPPSDLVELGEPGSANCSSVSGLGEVLVDEPERAWIAGSQVRITTRPATRRTSASPARQSVQWWMVKMASAASNAPSRKRQVLGDAPRRRARPRRPLREHHRRGFERGHHRAGRLVRTGPRADVQDALARRRAPSGSALRPGDRDGGSRCRWCRSCRSAGSSARNARPGRGRRCRGIWRTVVGEFPSGFQVPRSRP